MRVDYRTADDVDEVGVSEMVESARVNDHADRAEVKRQDARFALQTTIESTKYNVTVRLSFHIIFCCLELKQSANFTTVFQL